MIYDPYFTLFYKEFHLKKMLYFNTTEQLCYKINSTNSLNLNKLEQLSNSWRIFFLINIIVLSLIGVIGNSAVLFVSIRRKHRFMYKCCLVSLAFSDLLMAGTSGITHISSLSQRYYVWFIGKVMCSAVPFILLTALIANSMTLTSIAVDRYQSIVHALKFRWNPPPVVCYTLMITIWSISAAISYPMLSTYTFIEFIGIETSQMNPSLIINCKCLHRCFTYKKNATLYYLAALMISVFIPLLIAFLYLYINIAKMIWSHRKPPTEKNQEVSLATESQTDESSSAVKKSPKSITERKQSITLVTTENPPKSNLTKNTITATQKNEKNVSMERKLRTFKIILFIMILFFVCRMPNWIFMVFQMAFHLTTTFWWNLQYFFIILTILNSAINPFLYMFLNETIVYGNSVKKFLTKIFFDANNDVFQDTCTGQTKHIDKKRTNHEDIKNDYQDDNKNTKVRFNC